MVVQPSAACQLDCHYCGQEHTSDRLSNADQDAFVARVAWRLASGSYRRLRIGWFGAEPLLGMNVIRRMTPMLRAAAAEAGCDYGAKIVTNGLLLTGETAHELATDLGINFIEVTLDGLPEFHDGRRFRKNGGRSFDQIFRNLVEVARRDDVPADLSVRCNVDRSNAERRTTAARSPRGRGTAEAHPLLCRRDPLVGQRRATRIVDRRGVRGAGGCLASRT